LRSSAPAPHGSLTINHEEIAGLMPPMEMTFHVEPRCARETVVAVWLMSSAANRPACDDETDDSIGLRIG
jgi:hypothetical protein